MTASTSPPYPASSSFRERRSHLRLAFDCPVRWTDGSVDRYGVSRDVSPMGAGFTVRGISTPRPGQRIRLAFELDGDREWIVDENATVVRCDRRDDGLFDVGVELQPV